jgi:hypothetical protein
MLATKLGGVVMLFIALRAVGQAPDIQVPLMAYVVGMVFLLVAPVFQGIGVVEVSMAVALQHLGVPPAAAGSATLLTRVGELWLPLVTGVVMQLSELLRHKRPEPAMDSLPVAKGSSPTTGDREAMNHPSGVDRHRAGVAFRIERRATGAPRGCASGGRRRRARSVGDVIEDRRVIEDLALERECVLDPLANRELFQITCLVRHSPVHIHDITLPQDA